MFIHVFSHRIRCILRDREMMFWTLLFPVALATFFNMAFSNLNADEAFNAIPVAMVLNDSYPGDGTLKSTLDELSDDTGGEAIFALTETDLADAKALLEDGDVAAYIVSGETIEIYVKGSGFSQTIAKFIFDSILRTNSLAGKIIRANPGALAAGLPEYLGSEHSYIAQPARDESGKQNNTMIYFYSLIAMTCFYGAFAGIKEVNAVQADQSAQAMRVNVSPVKKSHVFLSSMAAATFIQYLSILVLLLFMKAVLRIDFGSQTGYILLLAFIGCITGVSYGTMLGVLLKGKEGAKIGLLIGTTMILSFFAGMMQLSVKYAFTKAFPPMAYINPLNVITDGFYALYYYPGHTLYFQCLAILTVFTLLFSVITVIRLRRVKYASL
ncbi:MAG: ABC transporter permease [Saccharofermentanales bacterium]